MKLYLKAWIALLSLGLCIIPIIPTNSQDNPVTLTDQQQAEIEAIIQHTLDMGQVGTVAWVATPSDSYSWAAGLASEANAIPIAADASFRVASVVKTFISAALLLMQEDRLLDLDDPLNSHLPDIAAAFSCGEQLTIRHLLNHTSSLYGFTSSTVEVDALLVSDRAIKPEELVAIAANTPYNCLYTPGTSFNYSNTNYVIASLVIEAAAGRPAEEVIRAYILDPLGLESTYFKGLEPARGFLVDNHTEFGPFDYNPLALGNGELISNGPDLIRFVQAVYTGEIFEDAASYDEMLNFIGAPQDDLSKVGYGLGLRKFSGDPLVFGHGGNIPGNLAMVLYAPEFDVTVIVLTSSDYSPEFDILTTTANIFSVVGIDFALPQ